MKIAIRALMLGLVSILLFSCQIGKTFMDELRYLDGGRGDEIFVTKDSKPYCGDFWSRDGKTFKMTTNSYGIIHKVIFYHPNGKIAYSMKLNNDGRWDKDTFMTYDEQGNLINNEEFMERYGSYMENMITVFFPKKLESLF